MARVQYTNYASSSKGTAHSISWPANTTAGNMLVLAVCYAEEGTATTASVPAPWSAVALGERVSRAPQLVARLSHVSDACPTGSAPPTTAPLSSSHPATPPLAEYSGMSTSGTANQLAGAQGNGTATNSGTAVTASGSAVWIGLIANKN